MSIVSVIIPVFNREKFIVDILTLLKKQNYRPLEVKIIVTNNLIYSYIKIRITKEHAIVEIMVFTIQMVNIFNFLTQMTFFILIK